MKRSVPAFFLSLALLVAPAIKAFSAESDDNAAAARVLESPTFLGETPAFSVDIGLEFCGCSHEWRERGNRSEGVVGFRRRRQCRFHVEAPEDTLELYTTKEKTFVLLKNSNRYIDRSGTGTRAATLTLMPSGPFRGSQMLLSDILHAAPAFQKTIGESTVSKAETSSVPDADQYAASNDDLDSKFWIQQGETPLLQQFSLDLTRLAAQQGEGIESAVVTYTFSNWNMSPDFPEGHFNFVIPEGAVAFSPAQNSQPAASPLEGLPAPGIQAPLLTGGEFDLAALKDKKIVVLDFWASWCGPCRIGLPIVTRVVEKYKEKDVVLITVNIGEDPATVQAFVEQMGMDVPVVLDQKQVAQARYQADSIPRTVIVDRDGTIKKVHAGLSPTLEKELDELLAELTD